MCIYRHIYIYIRNNNNLFVKTSLPFSLSCSLPCVYAFYRHFFFAHTCLFTSCSKPCIPVIHATMWYDHIAYDLSCYTYVLCILCGIDFLNLWNLDETQGVDVLNPSMVMRCSSLGAKIYLWYAWRFNVKTGRSHEILISYVTFLTY